MPGHAAAPRPTDRRRPCAPRPASSPQRECSTPFHVTPYKGKYPQVSFQ